MELTPQEEAHLEAADAIRYAHMAMEMVALLMSDMQQSGALRPTTKTKIQAILREGHDRNRSALAIERLRGRIGEASFQEKEQKRETPRSEG